MQPHSMRTVRQIRWLAFSALLLALTTAALAAQHLPEWPAPGPIRLFWRQVSPWWAAFCLFLGPLPLGLLLLCRSPRREEGHLLLPGAGFLFAAQLLATGWELFLLAFPALARWTVWPAVGQLFFLEEGMGWWRRLGWPGLLAGLFFLLCALPAFLWSAAGWR